MSIILFLLLSPIYLIIIAVCLMVYNKSKVTSMTASQKQLILEDETHDHIVSFSQEASLSAYDYKILALRKSLSEYLANIYGENFISWEAIFPQGLLRDNPIKIKVVLMNEIKEHSILKLATSEGFEFSIFSPIVVVDTSDDDRLSDTEDSTQNKTQDDIDGTMVMEEITAEDWINAHLTELEDLRDHAIENGIDYFTIDNDILPFHLKQEVKELLELEQFRMTFEEQDINVYF